MKALHRSFRGTSLLALAASAAALPSHAQAQDEATSEAAAVADVRPGEEIVVTGSRLGRTSFNSPTPVNVVGEDRMKDLAIPQVADALNQLPSFRATSTPQTSLFRVSGAIAGNTVDLRGLGATRTLTLLDGRRMVPSTDQGTVDLNGIPSALVQRTEIVTGGASAAYGADAVAGVVNLILNTKLTGVRVDVNAGISGHNDAKNYYASIAGGTDFGGGRGHVIAGLEYNQNLGVGACETRGFCRRYTNYVANPGFIPASGTTPAKSLNGLPATVVTNNVLFVQNPTGILLGVNKGTQQLGQQLNNTGAASLPAALRNLQFNSAGTGLVPFQFGDLLGSTFMVGGDPSVATLYGFGNVPLLTPTKHISALTHATYDIGDTTQMFGEFLYSYVTGGPIRNSVYTRPATTLSINNPFISPTVRAQLLAADPGITAIRIATAKEETGDNIIGSSANDIWRGVAGLKGKIMGNLDWDVAYTHGATHSRVDVLRQRLATLDTDAPNAITPPAGYTGTIYRTPLGAPVICASSVANPANGCVPVNLLGAGSFTKEQQDAYYRNAWQTRVIKQDTASINLRGDLLDLWAGPLAFAIGGEWRKDSASGDTDPISLRPANAGGFAAPTTTALAPVKRKVVEGYLEGSLPLLKDSAIGESLVVDGAVRYTHYNAFGNATTWKAGLVYQPVSDLTLRLTKSKDIRAPSAFESNPNATTTNLPINHPYVNGTVANITGGNPNLQLERAKTETAGVVFQPTFIPRLKMSLDYYRIRVNGAVDQLTAPIILNACQNQNLVCNLITWTGTPKAPGSYAVTVSSQFQNLSVLKADGFEFVGQYSIPDIAGGDINLSLNANYVTKLESVGGTGVVTKLDGVTGNAGSLTNVLGVPTWKADAVIGYSQDRWGVNAHMRYIPKSILDPTKYAPGDPQYDITRADSVNINHVDPAFYLDLSGTIKTGLQFLGENGTEFYWAVNNVLDKYPPKQLRFFGNPLHYDVVGRSFRVGMRTAF